MDESKLFGRELYLLSDSTYFTLIAKFHGYVCRGRFVDSSSSPAPFPLVVFLLTVPK